MVTSIRDRQRPSLHPGVRSLAHGLLRGVASSLTAAVLLTGLWMGPASAEEPARVLTVTGRGQVAVETAIATIRLGVSVEGESVEGVQAQVAERSDRIIRALEALDVEALQTTGISLFPQYSRDREPRITSVRGDNTVQFDIAVEEAGSTLDEAVAAGASRIDSISFRPTDEDSLAGRDEAIRLAVQDALVQAETTLDELDLSLVGIRQVQVNSNANTPVPVARVERAALSSDVSTPVVGGDRTISASVTLTIDY